MANELSERPGMAWERTDGAPGSRRIALLGYGACALAGGLWGTGFYWGRLAMNEMSVEHMVLYRFLFASLGIFPVLFFHRARLTGPELRILLVGAAFGIPIQFLVQFHGLRFQFVPFCFICCKLLFVNGD